MCWSRLPGAQIPRDLRGRPALRALGGTGVGLAGSLERTTTMTKKARRSSKQKVVTTKSEQIIGLLKRAHTDSIAELVKATSWQEHSIRGFKWGNLKKNLGLEITGSREEGRDRRYQIQAAS